MGWEGKKHCPSRTSTVQRYRTIYIHCGKETFNRRQTSILVIMSCFDSGPSWCCFNFHRCSVIWRPGAAAGRCCSIGQTAPSTSTVAGGTTNWWVVRRAGCVIVSVASMDQHRQTGQEVPITIHGWFGKERRGIPARLWSQVTCGYCIWPPSCSPLPPMLLHLLSLPLAVILPHTHTPLIRRILLFVCVF